MCVIIGTDKLVCMLAYSEQSLKSNVENDKVLKIMAPNNTRQIK